MTQSQRRRHVKTLRITLGLVLPAVTAFAAAGGEPNTPARRSALAVSGKGLTRTDLTLEELGKMTRKTVRVKNHDGAAETFEGVLVGDLLKKAGFTFGQHFRGPRMADYLVAEATDGYRVVFALPELDAEFSDRIVIVADRCNGKPLDDHDGPLRIVVSDEKKHARWVRNLAELTVGTAAP